MHGFLLGFCRSHLRVETNNSCYLRSSDEPTREQSSHVLYWVEGAAVKVTAQFFSSSEGSGLETARKD